MAFDQRLLYEGDYHETGGSEALTHLFDKGIPFSAVVCANDEMAAGAMAAAHDRGLRLPEELSIVGFDDAPISRYVYPKLSTVHYPITDMGHMAARWVLQNVYQQDNLDVAARLRAELRRARLGQPTCITIENVMRLRGHWISSCSRVL